MNNLVKIMKPLMNRSEVSGMTAVPVAASEEADEPDSPHLLSGLFNLNRASKVLEA